MLLNGTTIKILGHKVCRISMSTYFKDLDTSICNQFLYPEVTSLQMSDFAGSSPLGDTQSRTGISKAPDNSLFAQIILNRLQTNGFRDTRNNSI